MEPPAAPLDFDRFHREELPRWLAEGRGALAAPAARRLGGLAFRLPGGTAYSYLPRENGIDVVAGDERADTVVELEAALFENLVRELDTAPGLLYGGRARCPRGSAVRWLAWEPVLRAMFGGRPVYDADAVALRDRRGAPLDPARAFARGEPRAELAWFLREAGYLFVRGVFDAAEVGALRAEAAALAAEAVPGDGLSWWGRDHTGREVLTRVTRAAAKPGLRALPADPRIRALVDLADEPLAHRGTSGEEGVTVIWKRPRMREGLGDLPWHRDCGMGGHAVLCPILVVSVYLTPATPETGELRMLPGSWRHGCGPIDPRHPRAPRGVSFAAAPGDVSLHYGDTMHAAPPPSRDDLATYRISAVTAFARPGARPHRGRHYNEVLHRREDGQIEHLTDVVGADERR